MANLVFIIIITILAIDFALERFLDYLNGRKWSSDCLMSSRMYMMPGSTENSRNIRRQMTGSLC